MFLGSGRKSNNLVETQMDTQRLWLKLWITDQNVGNLIPNIAKLPGFGTWAKLFVHKPLSKGKLYEYVKLSDGPL